MKSAGTKKPIIGHRLKPTQPCKGFIFAQTFALVACLASSAAPTSAATRADMIKVFVSIAPQAYFVKRIGGDRVDVSIMVGPGQSPATYEPRPKQMADLGRAALYFRIGVPFEEVWIDRIAKTNPQLRVMDTRHGITLLPMTGTGPKDNQTIDRHHTPQRRPEGMKDPHVWLSLRLVKVQAQNIYRDLSDADPAHDGYYRHNLEAFWRDLDTLDAKIADMLTTVRTRKFLAFHPAWGYFAHDYGLEQIAIETAGKEPNAKSLATLIQRAREEGIRVILVQKQFSKRSAQAVADAIGGRIVQIDPLAQGYMDNMAKLAAIFDKELKCPPTKQSLK